MSDLPDELVNVEAWVSDFSTDEFLAEGLADITFTRQTDRLRVMRNLFEGTFRPTHPEEAEALKRRLIAGMSQGTPAMSMQVDTGGQTWVFIAKFTLQEGSFPFSGRAEPKLI